jgi:hypothetical protein
VLAKRWEVNDSSMKSAVRGAGSAAKTRPFLGRDLAAFWSKNGRESDV